MRIGSAHYRRYNRDKAGLCNVRHSQQGNLSLAGYSDATGAIISSLERLTIRLRLLLGRPQC